MTEDPRYLTLTAHTTDVTPAFLQWRDALIQLLNTAPDGIELTLAESSGGNEPEEVIGLTDIREFFRNQSDLFYDISSSILVWFIRNADEHDLVVLCSQCRLKRDDKAAGCRCESRGKHTERGWRYDLLTPHSVTSQWHWVITAASLRASNPGEKSKMKRLSRANQERLHEFLKHLRSL